jgi:hypothetical protein
MLSVWEMSGGGRYIYIYIYIYGGLISSRKLRKIIIMSGNRDGLLGGRHT